MEAPQMPVAHLPGVSCGHCRPSSFAHALRQLVLVPLDPPAPPVIEPPVVVLEPDPTPLVKPVVARPPPWMPPSPPPPLDFELLHATVPTSDSAQPINPADRAKLIMGTLLSLPSI